MTKQSFIACVGDNCIDRFGPPLNRSLVGGNAVNVAVQLARLGHRSVYFGAVGRDSDGARVAESLAANGVDIARLQYADLPTATTEIAVDEHGERYIGAEDFGACADYYPSDEDIALLTAARHCHFGWLNDGGRLAKRLREAGVPISRDTSINIDGSNLSLDGFAVAFASVAGPIEAAIAEADRLLASGVATAVVTRGAAGSLAKSGTETVEAGIVPVEVVDTTGAGDSFIAGFLAARNAGRDLAASLKLAAEVAARTCTHIGGFPQQAGH